MKIQYLLGIGLAAAMFAAACDNGSTEALKPGGTDPQKNTSSGTPAAGDDEDTPNTPGTTAPGGGSTVNDPPATGSVPTQSVDGKAFYIANVHPSLSKCTGCHQTAGPGPAFLNTDAETAYKQLFVAGYVIQQSRIVVKGPHGGIQTNFLSAGEITKFNDWVAMEIKDGKQTAQPNILATIGQCFDRQKFDAMQLQNWATTRRTNNNNQSGLPNNDFAENANNCTGCDNAPCRTCHTADSVTNFVDATGSNIVPSGFAGNTYATSADYTFGESKLTNPNFIRQYFGTTPDGKAIGSDGIKKKSDSTKKDRKYSHPMFTLNAQQQAGLDAFVLDAVTRYNAKSCGTTPATPAPAAP